MSNIDTPPSQEVQHRPRLLSAVVMIALILLSGLALARPTSQYLPDDTTLDPQITTPEAFFGFDVGQWHLTPHQINAYLTHLASQSPRIEVERYAYSHEQRPLLLAHISSAGNIEQRDTIEQRRANLLDSPDDQELLVLWMGYSVHGNEPSGANASVLLAYYLIASQDAWVKQLLNESMVLIDPVLNPDGVARFAQWVNSQRGTDTLNPDVNDREFNEPWPYSRTNHYWFDLNRDWLLLTHPESRGRVQRFHRWYPHVLTDFHEMGSDSTYFFQPGVPERTHPLTPQANQQLTGEIADFHAAELDRTGTLYWSREIFDDFYYGKGSTYPDIHGSLGILFEQASSRGHYRETANGKLAFDDTVSNQFRLSLSTLRGAWDKRDAIKRYQVDSLSSTPASGREAPAAGYVLDIGHDRSRAAELLEILRQHRIEVFSLAESTTADEHAFDVGQAMLIPADQPQHRLIQAIFERRTEFEDETFYDVSAFNLADAFGFPLAQLSRRQAQRLQNEPLTKQKLAIEPFKPHDDAVAYALDPRDFNIYPSLQSLLERDLLPRVSARPLNLLNTDDQAIELPAGAIVLPLNDRNRIEAVNQVLSELSDKQKLPPIHAVASGLTPAGPNLGSPELSPLEPVRALMITGEGLNMYEAGEVWHLLDTRAGMPLTRTDHQHLDRIDLNDYSHIILVSGDYSLLPEQHGQRLRDWIIAGGHLIAVRQAAPWAQTTLIDAQRYVAQDETTDNRAANDRPYGEHMQDLARHIIGGAIFTTRMDLSHPITFGFDDQHLALMRAGTQRLRESTNPYETPLRYTETPLRAGYTSEERQTELAGDPAAIVQRIENGTITLLADNPNFRGVWYGGNRLFLNAVFFAQAVRATPLPPDFPDPSGKQGDN